MIRFLTCVVMLALSIVKIMAADQESLQQTDVFISGTDGYNTYRIPALITSKKGVLLAFCEGRKHSKSDTGDIDLLLKRSIDNGKTWEPQQVIWDDAGNTCGNPCPVVDETTGTIWLLLTRNLGKDNEADIKAHKASETRTVWISKSTDEGKTWSKPKNITKSVKDPSWGWYATGPGVGIQLKRGADKGRLVIPCDHSYGEQREQGSHVIYSDNHGKSWKIGGAIRPKVNECQVVELSDGTLLMNMRSYFGRSCRTHSFSRDGGITWTEPKDAPELLEPVCQASILRYSWPENGVQSQILFSNPADPKRRVAMTVRLSFDEGKSWPVSKLIYPGFAAYSCLAVLPDKTVGCLYERGEKHSAEKITLARFNVDWVKQTK